MIHISNYLKQLTLNVHHKELKKIDVKNDKDENKKYE